MPRVTHNAVCAFVAAFYLLLVSALLFVLWSNTISIDAHSTRWRAYSELASEPIYWSAFINTLTAAALAATGVLAIFLSVRMAFRPETVPIPTVLRALFILPMCLPTIIRTMGWRFVLQDGGALEMVCRACGIQAALPHLLYTRTGVLVGLVHAYLPLGFLFADRAWQRVSWNLGSSAALLGATPIQVWLHILLPEVLPALIRTWLLLFVMTTGAVITPWLLGGASTLTVNTLIDSRLNVLLDLPLASALAALTATTIAILLLFVLPQLDAVSKHPR